MALPYATENQLKLLEQKTKSELDKRTENINLTADTLEDMNALVTNDSVTDGQLCYLKEDKKLYVLKDGVWGEVGGGGGGIPVVEGTESTITTGGAYATYTIPEAQTSCFIFKCDLGTAFISYNDVFGTYNGYLDADGSVTDGSLKLDSLIVLSGSGTEIDIFFGNIVSSGGTITSPTLDLVEKTSTGVFNPRTSITSNEYENLKNNLYNQVNYTDAIESSEDLPMALPTKIYKIDDNNYYFTQFSADGTGLSSLVLYKLAINNNNITIGDTNITVEGSADSQTVEEIELMLKDYQQKIYTDIMKNVK